MKKILRCLVSSILVTAMGIASLAALPQVSQADKLESGFIGMAAEAESIVVGNVEGQESYWNSEHTRIYTSVTVQVEESLKGSLSAHGITITVPGGEVDGITEVVSGTPLFSNGERMIAYLTKLKDGTYGVCGSEQGKITLADNKYGISKASIDDIRAQIKSAGQGPAGLAEREESFAVAGGPVITSVTPAFASAGTNTPVTITGSGFGYYTGTVYFFYRLMQPDIPGTIVSWTDTSIVVKVPVATVNGYPASASSGTIAVKTAGGVQSSYYPFEVTFAYGGMKWSGTNPVVNYYVNPNTADTTGEENGVRNAAVTWSNAAGGAFRLNYAGSSTAKGYAYNGRNEIAWVNMGSTSIIARATYWYSGARMLEADIEFNDYYRWSASANGISGSIDVESVALHEMGHWLCLRDLYGNLSGYPVDSDKVMCGYGSAGALKRTLDAADQAGIQWIYPGGVVSSITVTAPNGGETWQAGTGQTIGWSYNGNPGTNVKIELYKSGVLYRTVTSNTTSGSGGSGSYLWNAPATLENGSDYKIKITSLSNANYNDLSNSYFSLTGGALPPGITVDSPNGGESWQAGTVQHLSWSYTGNPGAQVTISLLDGSTTAMIITNGTSIGSSDSGSLDWTLPNTLYAGDNYRIMVTSNENPQYSDNSDAAFTITGGAARPTITVTSPNGGETWMAGTSQDITWSYTDDPGTAVKIELYRSGTLVTTISSFTSKGSGGTGSYTWAIPTTLTASSEYRIAVTSTYNASYTDTSDSNFSISAPPVPGITVVQPNGGESWQAGSVQTISWTYNGSVGSYIRIQLYRGSSLAGTIVSSKAIGSNGQGSCSWTLPTTLSAGSTYKIKITSTSKSAFYDYSDGYFSVTAAPRPGITVVTPNGGEDWKTGTTQTISWTYSGNPGSMVKIQLYKSGSLNRTLSYSTPLASGSYSWAIPANLAAGGNYKIRISSTSNSSYSDYSNNYFAISSSIANTISLTSPNGSQVWKAGTRQAIKWNYTGNPGSSVRIELLKNGSFTRVITYSSSVGSNGSGTYYWTLPSTLSPGSDYTIKVRSSRNSTIVDTSDAAFSITR